MSAAERWRARGDAWRFPSKDQAAANLERAHRRLVRPWVLAFFAAVWVVAGTVALFVDKPSIPLIVAAGITAGIGRTIGG